MSDSKKPRLRIEEPSVVPLRHVEDTGERYHGPHGRPTQMKKPTVSEIRARHEVLANRLSYDTDIPYLLDLVKRLGELAELILTETNPVNVLGPPEVTREMEKKARALLKELKQ